MHAYGIAISIAEIVINGESTIGERFDPNGPNDPNGPGRKALRRDQSADVVVGTDDPQQIAGLDHHVGVRDESGVVLLLEAQHHAVQAATDAAGTDGFTGKTLFPADPYHTAGDGVLDIIVVGIHELPEGTGLVVCREPHQLLEAGQ